jgi:uncharacterized protein (TIGR03792 family)
MLAMLVLSLLMTLLSGPDPAEAAILRPGPRGVEGATSVVELLRLRVPAPHRQAWLEAERIAWEPWLRARAGFEGRQLFWDPEREEGVLLIRWSSRDRWHGIPAEALEEVQTRFEAVAREGTGLERGNPFPLLFSGELEPM